MLEMLVCILMISSMLVIALNHSRQPDVEKYYFLNEYFLIQSQTMKLKCPVSYQKGISFNSMGHINLARTIEFGHCVYTFNLGNGYVLVR
ncbi:MAG: hypothetical protein K5908_05060 [Erysipelotrichaceae bacterium]|nr:hypothetical protein [Erysipelotrichaceae bacterium]